MIRISEPTFLGNEKAYVLDALEKRQLSRGEYAQRFERLVAEGAGASFAVAVNSGTAALHLALLALGVKPGDEVIVPACSYIATANAVRYCGAEPIFVDVDEQSWTAQPQAIAAAWTPKTVGVIIVHLYGVRAPLPKVPGFVLEDSCEAHGFALRGDAAVFSYYANKIIACGEGGAVVTNDPGLAGRVRLLHGQGTRATSTKYFHEALGFNYRMPELNAAVGCAQMERLLDHLVLRRDLRGVYDDELRGVPQQVRTPGSVDWVVPVIAERRLEVAAALLAQGVETRPVFFPLHLQPAYAAEHARRAMPVAVHLGRKGLLLPLHCRMNHEDVADVCGALRAALKEGGRG